MGKFEELLVHWFGQISCAFVLRLSLITTELGRGLFAPVEVPARDFLAIFATLVDEFVGGVLVFAEELDEVADGGDDGFAGLVGADLGHLHHVAEKVFEVANRVGKVDGVVDVTNYGFVGRYNLAEGLGQVIRGGVAENPNDLFPVADGKVDAEVFERGFVVFIC